MDTEHKQSLVAMAENLTVAVMRQDKSPTRRAAIFNRCLEALDADRDSLRAENARLLEENKALQENCPYPWCPECGVEARIADGDGLCSYCGTDYVWPEAADVPRRAHLVKEQEAHRDTKAILEATENLVGKSERERDELAEVLRRIAKLEDDHVEGLDPKTPCEQYRPGSPRGNCETDGHYMCSECAEKLKEPHAEEP